MEAEPYQVEMLRGLPQLMLQGRNTDESTHSDVHYRDKLMQPCAGLAAADPKLGLNPSERVPCSSAEEYSDLLTTENWAIFDSQFSFSDPFAQDTYPLNMDTTEQASKQQQLVVSKEQRVIGAEEMDKK